MHWLAVVHTLDHQQNNGQLQLSIITPAVILMLPLLCMVMTAASQLSIILILQWRSASHNTHQRQLTSSAKMFSAV
jgi:hypothetical protein